MGSIRSAAVQIRTPSSSSTPTQAHHHPHPHHHHHHHHHHPSPSSSPSSPSSSSSSSHSHPNHPNLQSSSNSAPDHHPISLLADPNSNSNQYNPRDPHHPHHHHTIPSSSSSSSSSIPSTGRKSSPSSPRKLSLPHPTRPATASPITSNRAGLTTNAPVFVPSGTRHPSSSSSSSSSSKVAQQIKLNKSAAEFAPSGLALSDSSALYNPSNASDLASSFTSSSSTPYPNDSTYHPHNPYAYDSDRLLHSQPHHPLNESYLAHDSYLSHTRVSAPSLSNFQRPLNYHLYAPPLPHSSNQHPHQLALNRFFMPASIRETLQRKSAAVLQGPTHEVARTPEDLGAYHSLVVLDSPHATLSSTSSNHPSISIGVTNGTSVAANNSTLGHLSPYSSRILKNPCWVYKAFSSTDGKAYCLYRLEGVRLKSGQGEAAIGQVERWRKIRHPAIVNVREAFTTRAFGDHSILFAYDYHPLSHTLYDEHISPKKSSTRSFGVPIALEVDHPSNPSNNINPASKYNRHRPTNGNPARVGLIEERLIWSYVMQVANAIRAVHSANLAVRTIDPTKIILTGANRVRINACGILDVTEYSPNQSLEDLQLDDLRDLGSLICSLASSSICTRIDPNSLAKGIEYIKQFYSTELNEVISYLLGSTNDPVTIDGLLRTVWSHGLDEMTKVFNHNDLLEECLCRELENGRLVRLMTKLGFINERPEFDHDPNWSETSERYLLKLFRDYVFHQVDSHGKPVTDLSHVLVCLNKLDASSDERITLISRDDQTCAIVSYAEIRRIMDSAFRDLSR